MEPRIYMSTDEGAPVLSATAGSLIGVLDACLVTGYGDLPGAGWEKFAIGADNAAYRAPDGLRHYLHVLDTIATYATVNGYKSLVDTDFGSAFSSSPAYWGKCASGVTAGRQWVVAVDDKRVLIFVVPSAAINVGFRAVGGFGELAAHHPDDMNASYLLAGSASAAVLATDDAALVYESGLIIGSGQQVAYMPGLFGSTSAPGKYNASLNGAVATASPQTTDAPDMLNDYVWSSRLLMRNYLSSAQIPSSLDFTNIHYALPRGYIPGLLVPMMEMLPSVFPFWTSLGDGQYVIPYGPRRCYILDTADWEYQ